MKLITILLILLPFLGKSQQLINQKDPFTGKQIKAAVVTLGSSLTNTGHMIALTVDSGKKYISYTQMIPSGQFGAFNEIKLEDTSIMIKLATDKILIFKTDTTLSKLINSGNTSLLAIQSQISDDELKVLSNDLISIFRFGIKDGVGVDSNLITNKNKEQIKKAAFFILSDK